MTPEPVGKYRPDRFRYSLPTENIIDLIGGGDYDECQENIDHEINHGDRWLELNKFCRISLVKTLQQYWERLILIKLSSKYKSITTVLKNLVLILS